MSSDSDSDVVEERIIRKQPNKSSTRKFEAKESSSESDSEIHSNAEEEDEESNESDLNAEDESNDETNIVSSDEDDSSEDSDDETKSNKQSNKVINSNNSFEEEQSDDEEQRTKIRSEISSMPFEDLMKLKEKLGAKVYNETIFGQQKSRNKPTAKKAFKRENKNRPREMGAKRPVPFLGDEKKKLFAVPLATAGPRDPRFDANCGEFDANKFKENFAFVNEIKEKELIELKEQLKTSTDPKEVKKIKYLVQRMQNQKTEARKRKIREEVLAEEKQEIKKAKQEQRMPHYRTDKERKTHELIRQFMDLKESGKLNKHLEKRRKKVASRDRKKFSFD